MDSHPSLKGKMALKGGTTLNLFVLDVPRLSVDVDLNYIGTEDREAMLKERPSVDQALQAVFSRQDFSLKGEPPNEHTGGKWSLRYNDAFGRPANLEVDVNYLFRIPLWPIQRRTSRLVGAWQVKNIPVLDAH